MNEDRWLADRFEDNRTHLRAVAYRMLGSVSEADDAVQESWLRLSRADISGVENLRGWLTTVVARVSLDRLHSRAARREVPLGPHVPEPIVSPVDGVDPEHEALLADSIGLALLVVLETLGPAERLAFVLHDMFPSRTTRLPRSSVARRTLHGSSPAARAAGYREPARSRTLISAVSARSSMRSWRLRAAATSTRFWPCWTPRSCSGSTAARSPLGPPGRSVEPLPWSRRCAGTRSLPPWHGRRS